LVTITPPSSKSLRQPSGEDSDPCVDDGEESEGESETGGSERKDNNQLAPSNGLPMSVSAPAPGVVDRRTDRLRKRTSLQRKNRYSVTRGLTNPIPTSNGSSQNPNNNGGLPYSYSVPSFLELAARNGVSMAGTLLSPRSPSRRPQSIIIFGKQDPNTSTNNATGEKPSLFPMWVCFYQIFRHGLRVLTIEDKRDTNKVD